MSEDTRLQRIEQKLDKLSDAVVVQARMAEQLVTLFKRMDRHDTEQRELVRQVAQLEQLSAGRGIFFRALDKLVWLIAGCLVAAAVALLGRPP